MSTPISVNFKNVPLEGVVDQLHSMTNINFDLDLRGLKEGTVDPKQSITANLKDVSLKSALSIICQQAGLKHVIENEAIRITTPKNAQGRQLVKSLPVGDLVIPAPNYVSATPGLSLTDSLRMATENAYGLHNRGGSGNSSMHSPGLPGGMGTGSTSNGLPGVGRMVNSPSGPREGGVTTGSTRARWSVS